MIKRILKRKNINFYVDEYQAIGLVYPFEGKDYVVTAAAYDGYRYTNPECAKKYAHSLIYRWIERIGGCGVYPFSKHFKTDT